MFLQIFDQISCWLDTLLNQTNLFPLPFHDMVAELGGGRVFQSAARFLHQQINRLTMDEQTGSKTMSDCEDV